MNHNNAIHIYNSLTYTGDETLTPFGLLMLSLDAPTQLKSDYFIKTKAPANNLEIRTNRMQVASALREWANTIEGESIGEAK